MKRTIAITLLAVAGTAQADGLARWYEAHAVDESRLTITYEQLSGPALADREREWTGRAVSGTQAISRLVYTKSGEYRCTIAHIAGVNRNTLEHERKHCRGFEHR